MAKPTAGTSPPGDTVSAETLGKVLWRILPFLFICYVVNYLDRVNIGLAALAMNKDLNLSPSQFGWGAGLFFIGYFLFRSQATSCFRPLVHGDGLLSFS